MAQNKIKGRTMKATDIYCGYCHQKEIKIVAGQCHCQRCGSVDGERPSVAQKDAVVSKKRGQTVGEKWGTDPNSTAAGAIAEMMAGWNKIEAAAKLRFPGASKEELYQICKGAMNHALNIRG